jgi:CheY-like chemotaxis protein
VKHILIVDDDPEVRRAVRRGLQRRGYRVAEAIDGSHGLSTIQEQGPFDVVLSDMDMPKADGLELWHQLQLSGDPHADRLIFHTTNAERLSDFVVPVVRTKGSLEAIEAEIGQL